jgi:hypothetical protein
MSPFESIVVKEALEEGRAEIGIKARIILVGINWAGTSRRTNRHRSVCCVCTIEQASRCQRDACQNNPLHCYRPTLLSKRAHPALSRLFLTGASFTSGRQRSIGVNAAISREKIYSTGQCRPIAQTRTNRSATCIDSQRKSTALRLNSATDYISFSASVAFAQYLASRKPFFQAAL